MKRQDIIEIFGSGIREMAYELCTRAGLKEMIRAGCPGRDPLIALKPNLVGPIPAEEGATTHPEIVEGVVSYLKDSGFSNLSVMESSWVGDKTTDALLVTGFGDLCKRLGVPFYDLQSDKGIPVDCAGMRINICAKVLKVDYLINLPVMKGHCQTRMTCALKNLKGCIPASEKRRFHRMGLHEPIGHLGAGLKQDFILADAICPDLTFEDGGNPVPLGRMMCAVDPVLMDAYACKVIGVREESVPYIRIAEECGAGRRDLSLAQVTCFLEKNKNGRGTYTKAEIPFDEPPGDYRKVLKVKELVSEMDSCSACYGTLIPVLHLLEQEGILTNLPWKLCIGQGYRQKRGKIGIGSCTSGFDTSLAGCPPSAREMESFIRGLLRESGQT